MNFNSFTSRRLQVPSLFGSIAVFSRENEGFDCGASLQSFISFFRGGPDPSARKPSSTIGGVIEFNSALLSLRGGGTEVVSVLIDRCVPVKGDNSDEQATQCAIKRYPSMANI